MVEAKHIDPNVSHVHESSAYIMLNGDAIFLLQSFSLQESDSVFAFCSLYKYIYKQVLAIYMAIYIYIYQ